MLLGVPPNCFSTKQGCHKPEKVGNFPMGNTEMSKSMTNPINQTYWVRARSQLGTRYMGKQLKSSCLARNEFAPSMTKNTASGISNMRKQLRFLMEPFGLFFKLIDFCSSYFFQCGPRVMLSLKPLLRACCKLNILICQRTL
jgi:hypothetical protein